MRGITNEGNMNVVYERSKRNTLVGLSTLFCLISSVLGAQDYDPLAYAVEQGDEVVNLEAVIPSQCYTKTDGVSNPCWTCHTTTNGLNSMGDWDLQEEYAFSDFGLINHWDNLFADRSAVIADISDDEILSYVREDNYTPLREALAVREDYPGWRPDLDYRQGFDADGFANDGTWWRAFRYKPFLGTFWPTNGSTDDVLIRLPSKFYRTEGGDLSRAVYKINLALLEAAMAVSDDVADEDVTRTVEPVDESIAGFDLDGDGSIGGLVTRIHGLPDSYVGAAADEPVQRHIYPFGTEFLHTVRYVDPDSPSLLSTRMKEVRYGKRMVRADAWQTLRQYELELDEKDEGRLPVFTGSALVGLRNGFGWQYQGFIEDAEGRLRLQSREETTFCMGCHSTIGVTVDQSFGFPRKQPGAPGWGHQDIAGIPDVAQTNMDEPEILTYFKRVKGGDEFRANEEILERFFPGGEIDEALVREAAPAGLRDIAWLLAPSRERALMLNKAYRALVMEQSFELGRDAVTAPTVNVHEEIVNGSTDLAATDLIFTDGRMWLDWSNPYGDPEIVDAVQSVYIAYYRRAADAAGLDFWAAGLTAQDGSLDAIIDAFANSEEATSRFGDLTDEELVDSLYLDLFRREPDEAGREFYLEALANGETTIARVALDMLNGATGDDAIIIANKLEVAQYFTDQVVNYERRYEDIEAARSVLAGVDSSRDSVEAAMENADTVIQSMPEA